MTPGPWLAVPDRTPRLHDAEGCSLVAPDLQNLQRTCANKQITSLAWHPSQPVLVMGSDTGKCFASCVTCALSRSAYHLRFARINKRNFLRIFVVVVLSGVTEGLTLLRD